MTVGPVRAAPDLDGSDWALFLDIDGTLLDYAEHPEAVAVSDGLRDLLAGLERKFGGAVAFVTGRPVAMVDRLFSPLLLPAAGVFGLEHRLKPDGPVEFTGTPADLDALADELEAEFAGESVFIERKGAVLGVHTRTAPHVLARATELVERALARLPEGYRLLHGNIGFELMPLEAVKAGDHVAARKAAMEHMSFVERSMAEAERTGDWQRVSRLRLRQRSDAGETEPVRKRS